jgi:hypothetical protein
MYRVWRYDICRAGVNAHDIVGFAVSIVALHLTPISG